MITKRRMSTAGLTLVAMFSALTAIGAFIRIPVPVVPFALQILFVYFAGSLLGSRLGAASQLVYLAVGLAGVPVFTEGGGVGYVLKPTFGYLLGFVLAAYAIGRLIEKKENPQLRDFTIAHFLGLFIVYVCGTLYLYIAMNFIAGTAFSLWNTFLYGFLLAVPGDIVLCIAASVIGVKVFKQISPLRQRIVKDVKA
jgi:biotin transport system substrate-specific component